MTDRDFPSMLYWAKATAVAITVACVFALAFFVRGTLFIVLVAFIVAVGLEPSVNFLQRLKISHGVAVAIIYIVTAFFTILIVIIALPPIVSAANRFVEALPGYVTKLADRIPDIRAYVAQHNLEGNLRNMLTSLPNLVFGLLAKISISALRLGELVVLTLYFMIAMPRLKKTMIQMAGGGEPRAEALNKAFDRIGGYVTGNVLTSLFAGVVTLIILLVMKVPYAPLLAVWVTLWDLIPTIGPTMGAALCVAVAAFQGLPHAAVLVVFFIILTEFISYVLAPRVYSKKIDLSPIAVLVAIMIGGAVMGIVGALLALPITAAGKVLLQYYYSEYFGKP